NEAVELAKKYDHDQAPTFINGILNAIATASGFKKQA
ncbi:MAG: N utilization substance protein B, partial [Clostridia bacterium]|nr:N utilization substance protein B [Clostridia bacterium]